MWVSDWTTDSSNMSCSIKSYRKKVNVGSFEWLNDYYSLCLIDMHRFSKPSFTIKVSYFCKRITVISLSYTIFFTLPILPLLKVMLDHLTWRTFCMSHVSSLYDPGALFKKVGCVDQAFLIEYLRSNFLRLAVLTLEHYGKWKGERTWFRRVSRQDM